MTVPDRHLSQNPIFVVGYPRSGTTLLQALMATQGNLATFPETHFFSTVYAGNAASNDSLDLEAANEILRSINQKSGMTLGEEFVAVLKKIPEPS